MSTKRKPRAIHLPESDSTTAAAAAAAESQWAVQGQNPGGLYPDPEHSGRFHRKGRSGKRPRTVRRITVYVDDDLAIALDVYRAKAGGTTRSEVLETALRAHLSPASSSVAR